MKIYLSEKQFQKLWSNEWKNQFGELALDGIKRRQVEFRRRYPTLFYDEAEHLSQAEPNFFGSVSGEEKYITMFLLQL